MASLPRAGHKETWPLWSSPFPPHIPLLPDSDILSMELRHLRHFLAGADAKTFHAPRNRACLAALPFDSDPRPGRGVRNLVFDRLRLRAMLTRAGEIFREHAERVMREPEQASQSVQELRSMRKGRLVVGSLSTVNSYLIPLLAAHFTRRFPGIHLRMQATTVVRHCGSLLANRLDLGICLIPVVDDRLTTTPLFDERLALVAPTCAFTFADGTFAPSTLSTRHCGIGWIGPSDHPIPESCGERIRRPLPIDRERTIVRLKGGSTPPDRVGHQRLREGFREPHT